MTTAVQASNASGMTATLPARRPAARLNDKLLGLALASLAPALFWTALLAVFSRAIGQALAADTLALIGAVIAAFLAVVVGSLMGRDSARD